MEKRAEIIIYGRIQKAGYKDFIDEVAFNLDINGNVENLENGTVQIICEGEEDNIKELIKKINIKQYPIRVEKIDEKYKRATGEFKTFEIIRDKDMAKATYERMDSAARYMREMNSNLGNKIDNLSTNLGGKIDSLITETNDNFEKMDKKYRLISEAMLAIADRIEKRQDSFEKTIEKSEKNIERLLEILEKRL